MYITGVSSLTSFLNNDEAFYSGIKHIRSSTESHLDNKTRRFHEHIRRAPPWSNW